MKSTPYPRPANTDVSSDVSTTANDQLEIR
jgi:hypothetical protein